MTNFSHLSESEVEAEMLRAVDEEKKAQTHVLHLLAEVERRRIYSKQYPSLFEYCVKVLKYSAGAAQRRIDTMRAMKLIPEIEIKIVSGELNLSTVSQAQKFWRHEAKQNKPHSLNEKRVLLEKLGNKSARECTEMLVELSPHFVPQEKRRLLTLEKTELKVVLDQALIEKLDRLKALLSHKHPQLTDAELIGEIVDIALVKLDPAQKVMGQKRSPAAAKTRKDSLPTSEVGPSRYISRALRQAVWRRDQGRCSHCGSTHFLEIDHIKPLALGGKTALANLRLLCRAHNTRAALDVFGLQKMKRFLRAK